MRWACPSGRKPPTHRWPRRTIRIKQLRPRSVRTGFHDHQRAIAGKFCLDALGPFIGMFDRRADSIDRTETMQIPLSTLYRAPLPRARRSCGTLAHRLTSDSRPRGKQQENRHFTAHACRHRALSTARPDTGVIVLPVTGQKSASMPQFAAESALSTGRHKNP